MIWYARPEARLWRTRPAPGDVQRFHAGLAAYEPTPLVDLPELATELGVGRLLVKDESSRLGLPAFKVLGASWAIHRGAAGAEELVTATDGNHGRAVAWMARQRGIRARVFVPEEVGAGARTAIESEGARLVVVRDSYDAAVEAADRYAQAEPGRVLVQDTAWPGYEEIPAMIVDGYSTLFREIDVEPGLVVVPMGVGSLAQAAVTHFRSGDSAPAVLGVEPAAASCVTESLLAGKPVSVETGSTIMAGLNCGTPSSLAWPVLRDGMDASITVEDAEAARAVEDLARLGVSSGPSGAATLAGVRAALNDPVRRQQLAIDETTTVILLSTEGLDATRSQMRA